MSEPIQTAAIYDKRGIPILPGDTVKVFHFKDRRGRNRFMYKYALGTKATASGSVLLELSHLDIGGETFFMLMDNQIQPNMEIVQGYGGCRIGESFSDRKRFKANHPEGSEKEPCVSP